MKKIFTNITINKQYIKCINETFLYFKSSENFLHTKHLSTQKVPSLQNEKLELKVNELIPNPLDNPNIFGTLSKKTFLNEEAFTHDEGDKKEEKRSEFKPLGKKLRTKQYADMIKKYLKENRLKEAIDVLEEGMIKEDRIKPENYIYSLLIGGCGRVGYTKKAFKLFNDMKKRGLKVHPGVYTGLFNACANSPWKEDGLSRATQLLELIREKNYLPNTTNYHAIIKVFGRHGDLTTAFGIVDEMLQNRISIQTETINFLLQACVSNMEEGFRYALLVWRKMLDQNLSPNIYSFNLMLRAVRDCGLGDSVTANEVVQHILTSFDMKKSDENILKGTNQKLISNSMEEMENSNSELGNISTNSSVEKKVDSVENILFPTKQLNIKENRPSLLAKVPHLGNIVSLNEIVNPEDRLILVGGVVGILEEMQQYSINPDIKTFSQLLDCIPPTRTAEQNLMKIMKKMNIKPDIDFFNMLIKKRSQRFDHEGGKEVLHLIDEAKLEPDLITFGVLAIGCRDKEEARILISLMKAKGYRINSEILGAMLQQACYRNNFGYVMELMETCFKETVPVNSKFMERLAEFRSKCLKMIREKTHKDVSDGSYFKEGFRLFNLRYQTWKTQIKIDESELAHPWKQFREATETDTKYYKDPKKYFKPQHLSKFRVKTSTKVRY